jgi:hypothetical protein
MEEIKFTFTAQEVQTILFALGKQPLEMVADLFFKIRQEAATQLNDKKEEKLTP